MIEYPIYDVDDDDIVLNSSEEEDLNKINQQFAMMEKKADNDHQKKYESDLEKALKQSEREEEKRQQGINQIIAGLDNETLDNCRNEGTEAGDSEGCPGTCVGFGVG